MNQSNNESKTKAITDYFPHSIEIALINEQMHNSSSYSTHSRDAFDISDLVFMQDTCHV